MADYELFFPPPLFFFFFFGQAKTSLLEKNSCRSLLAGIVSESSVLAGRIEQIHVPIYFAIKTALNSLLCAVTADSSQNRGDRTAEERISAVSSARIIDQRGMEGHGSVFRRGRCNEDQIQKEEPRNAGWLANDRKRDVSVEHLGASFVYRGKNFCVFSASKT